MVKSNVTQLGHVTPYAPVPDLLAGFYETVLSLQIVAQSKLNAEGSRSSAYLTCQSDATAYQLSISANPDMQHIAFEVSSLAQLKAGLYANS